MSDIFDYLKWRGDLSFERDGFNEVDNLIFSSLAYIDFEGIVPKGSCTANVTLHQAALQLKALQRSNTKNAFFSRFPELLEKTAQTNRFKDVLLTCYISELDYAIPNQFSSIVFSINKKEHYLAFRGTDDNLAGWKEDFLMSFKEVVLAQLQAVDYVNTVLSHLRGRFFIGGHSKGGNLAIYAAAYTNDKNRNRITAIFNNDGPGFQKSIISTTGYHAISKRIHTFIPKSSVVGMLLEHGDDYKIVSSSENLITSHNPLTWAVSGTSFVLEKELSKTSLQINEALQTWLASLTLEQREQFVEGLFDVIHASGAETLTDLSNERLTVIDAMVKKIKSMDKETRGLLKDTAIHFLSIRQRLIRESISESFEALLMKNK